MYFGITRTHVRNRKTALGLRLFNDKGKQCVHFSMQYSTRCIWKWKLYFTSAATLRIECIVSVCFFKFCSLPYFLSNAKWIWISLECLMVELYLDIFLSGLFSRKSEISWTRKINTSYILSSSAKSCWGYTTILISFYFL